MKKFLLFVIVAFLISACSGTTASSIIDAPDDKLDEIIARGTLIIATDANYPPQSLLNPLSVRAKDTKCEQLQYTANQMTGFDVQVAVEIARSLGVEPCFVTPPWSQLVAGNWQNNWDIHVGSVAITHDRMENLYFTQPYYATPTLLLVHEDSTVTEVEEVSGKRIGVCSGCAPEKYLFGTLELPGQQIVQKIKDADVIAYENEAPALADLVLGDGIKLDAVVTMLPIAAAAIDSGMPLKIVEPPLFFGYASVTVDRKTNRDPSGLVNAINWIIQQMHASGRLREISLAYIGVDLTAEAASFDLSSLEFSP